MAFSVFAIFFTTLLISFIGSLPFGPINLVMIDLTINYRLRSSYWFAVAAALVEMGQSFVALWCSAWLWQLIHQGTWVKLAGFFFFLLLGTVFFFKKGKENTHLAENSQKSFFLKGLVVAVLNPQAIPFWVIMLTFLSSASVMNITAKSPLFYILFFNIGAASGKLLALLLFGILSERIMRRSYFIRHYINRIIGIILIGIGVFQGVLFLFT